MKTIEKFGWVLVIQIVPVIFLASYASFDPFYSTINLIGTLAWIFGQFYLLNYADDLKNEWPPRKKK